MQKNKVQAPGDVVYVFGIDTLDQELKGLQSLSDYWKSVLISAFYQSFNLLAIPRLLKRTKLALREKRGETRFSGDLIDNHSYFSAGGSRVDALLDYETDETRGITLAVRFSGNSNLAYLLWRDFCEHVRTIPKARSS